MLDWIATIVLAVFAGFAFWMAEAGWQVPVAVASFALAAIAMFPPIWRRQANPRWRVTRYPVAAALTVIGLLTPIKTHAVKLDMPTSSSHR